MSYLSCIVRILGSFADVFLTTIFVIDFGLKIFSWLFDFGLITFFTLFSYFLLSLENSFSQEIGRWGYLYSSWAGDFDFNCIFNGFYFNFIYFLMLGLSTF